MSEQTGFLEFDERTYKREAHAANQRIR